MVPDAYSGTLKDQHASFMEDYEKEIIDGPSVDESLYDEPPPQPHAAYTVVHDLGGREEVKVRESQSLETRAQAQSNQENFRLLPQSQRAQDQLTQPPPAHATSSIKPPTAPAIAPPVPVAHPLASQIALPPPPPIVLPPFSAFAPPVAAPIATAPPLAMCAPPTPITRSFMPEFGILRVGQGTRFDDHSEELQIDNHRPSGMVPSLCLKTAFWWHCVCRSFGSATSY
ncbi:uncharacterized protein SCHCODRAFT_02502958 [Schizophyllum commune H4-8]|nr:uncharacterized protein SCHCODRAFT_02502958 [Schizophyllum commune H4-8]KAI5891983.1 hypothetical protein SCHCODRAFT_02502958 [Schizophyllum commune H4-8]